MPFGLTNAPATFQRAVQLVFQGMVWNQVLTYIDDINVLGKTFEEHLENLRESLKRLRKFNLKLKPRKCQFFQKEVPFLGRLATLDGIAVDPIKIKAIKEWPVPVNKQQVMRFIGFAAYHRSHIAGFATIAEPLHALTEKKATFVWEDKHQQAFDALREAVINAPVRAYPNDRDQFILDTDASDTGIGGELIQVQKGVERTVAFGSFLLTPAQRNYCATRKELLAVVRLTREYRHYLLGRSFIMRTDHHSLVWLMRFKNPQGMLARWLEELSQFDMTIQHRSGKQHGNADGLSRRPAGIPQCNCYEAGVHLEDLPCGGCKYCTRLHGEWHRFEEDVDDVVPLAVRRAGVDPDLDETIAYGEEQDAPDDQTEEEQDVEAHDISADFPDTEAEHLWIPQYTSEELRTAQDQDASVGTLIQWLEAEHQPSSLELRLSTPTVRRFWMSRAQLILKERVLYYTWEGTSKQLLLVVPKSLVQEVLTGCHDCPTSGHLGISKTLARVKQTFMWHSLRADVTDFVKSCQTCNRNKKSRVKPKARMGVFHAGARMERVHMDMLGPFPDSNRGNRYILVMVDQFTKWVEIHALPAQTAIETARCAVDQFFTRFGTPLEIHTDQGKNFDGNLMHALCDLYRIAKTRTTPYHPCSNGQVERYNRLLLQMIRCYLKKNDRDWDVDLQLLAGAIRDTYSSLGSLFKQFMGHKDTFLLRECLKWVCQH
jgi:transposase InsO family protein